MIRRSDINNLAQAGLFHLQDYKAKDMSPNTLITKRQSLDRFFEYCEANGISDPNDVDSEVMEAYRGYLHGYRKKNGQPLSINTKYKFLTDLKLFLRFLYRRKVISNADFENFESPRSQKKIPRAVWSEEEMEIILSMPLRRGDDIGIRDRGIMEVFYVSAIRRAELANLKLGRIDLDQELLMVIEGKSLKDRVIPIVGEACQWLEVYLETIRPKYATAESGNAMFLRPDGIPLNADNIGQTIGKYVSRSGVNKPGSCHQFRHAVATSMLNRKMDLRYLQEFLGHKDISNTEIYTQVAKERLREMYSQCHPAAKN